MRVRSLGSGLLGVLGIYLLTSGLITFAATIPVLMSAGSAPRGGLPIGIVLVAGLTLLLPVVLGTVLLIARDWITARVFAEDEVLEVSAGSPQWIAVLLLVLGLWFLVEAIASFMTFVQWGPTPFGFPFRFAEIPSTVVWGDGFRGVVGLLLILRSGRLAARLLPVTRSV